MYNLMVNNFQAQGLNVSSTFCAYKHRYQLPHSGCPPLDQTLVIVMLRNPYDWALAMHERCWCGTPRYQHLAELPFEKFLTKLYFNDNSPRIWINRVNKSLADTTCGTVMQCRSLKILNFLNISQWHPNVEYVRHESVIQVEDSLRWTKALVKRWGLEGYVPKKMTKSQRSLSATDDLDIKIPLTYKSNKRGRQFNVTEHMMGSVWFRAKELERTCSDKGPNKSKEDKELCGKIRLISDRMDQTVESLVGYSSILSLPGELPLPWTFIEK